MSTSPPDRLVFSLADRYRIERELGAGAAQARGTAVTNAADRLSARPLARRAAPFASHGTPAALRPRPDRSVHEGLFLDAAVLLTNRDEALE
jgi:hypothetical protein